jgi:hypothetical protein
MMKVYGRATWRKSGMRPFKTLELVHRDDRVSAAKIKFFLEAAGCQWVFVDEYTIKSCANKAYGWCQRDGQDYAAVKTDGKTVGCIAAIS